LLLYFEYLVLITQQDDHTQDQVIKGKNIGYNVEGIVMDRQCCLPTQTIQRFNQVDGVLVSIGEISELIFGTGARRLKKDSVK
jgi:hypothetical protein